MRTDEQGPEIRANMVVSVRDVACASLVRSIAGGSVRDSASSSANGTSRRKCLAPSESISMLASELQRWLDI